AVHMVVADGRHAPRHPVEADAGGFDRVLVDAPCTGLGVLRRRPEARWRVRPNDSRELARVQRELLWTAANLARPGATIVYSVCTLTREETLGVDRWAAEELPDLEVIEPPGSPWRAHGRGALLMPHDADTDGMFVLLFRRPATSAPPRPAG